MGCDIVIPSSHSFLRDQSEPEVLVLPERSNDNGPRSGSARREVICWSQPSGTTLPQKDILDTIRYRKVRSQPIIPLTASHPNQILRDPPPQTPNPLQSPRLPLDSPFLRKARNPLRLHAPRTFLPPPRLLLRRLLERSLRSPRLNTNLYRAPATAQPPPPLPPFLNRYPKGRYPRYTTMATPRSLAVLDASGTPLIHRGRREYDISLPAENCTLPPERHLLHPFHIYRSPWYGYI